MIGDLYFALKTGNLVFLFLGYTGTEKFARSLKGLISVPLW